MDEVERVARAICAAFWNRSRKGEYSPMDEVIDVNWQIFRSEAKAAIAALRAEPDPLDAVEALRAIAENRWNEHVPPSAGISAREFAKQALDAQERKG